MIDDPDTCYRALQARDARFDGWFVTAVLTTRIYCRPSCPAMLPHRENVRFYATAAAAQRAGFRACKRCRPDASPGSPEWDARGDLVARAMRLIADGVVDREGVGGLAARLGYSRRQVERALLAELGAGPLAIARAQRARTARTLLESTSLRAADIAFAAGFASVRQFNDTVREVFAMTPTGLRARARRHHALAAEPAALDLRLPVRAPFDVEGAFSHLARTAVPGVEEVVDGEYRRALTLPHGPATVALRAHPDHVACRLRLTDLRDLATAVARCRFLLDLDADPVTVDRHLGEERRLRPLVRAAPGRRVPRSVDAHEMAVRAVLGQQVSTAAAAQHAARLVLRAGAPIDAPAGGVTHTFPTADAIAGLRPARLKLPAARARTVLALAGALASGALDLSPGTDRDAARAALAALPGIGPWTVETIAMRGLGDPDAFPVGDLGVRRGAARVGLPDGARPLATAAQRWRPWRAYAVMHLWSASARAHERSPR